MKISVLTPEEKKLMRHMYQLDPGCGIGALRYCMNIGRTLPDMVLAKMGEPGILPNGAVLSLHKGRKSVVLASSRPAPYFAHLFNTALAGQVRACMENPRGSN